VVKPGACRGGPSRADGTAPRCESAARTATAAAAIVLDNRMSGTPVVATSGHVSVVLPGPIRRWVRDGYVVLGTDGFRRSDTRASLRRFF